MSDKELLQKIQEHTESINKLFRTHNPYDLPSEVRPIYQQLADDVRNISSDVRVALRNYDTLLAEHNSKLQQSNPNNLKLVAQ